MAVGVEGGVGVKLFLLVSSLLAHRILRQLRKGPLEARI